MKPTSNPFLRVQFNSTGLIRYTALALGLAFAGLSMQSVKAADKTWSGTTDQTWDTGTNWGGTTPVNADRLFINTSTGNTPIITSVNAAVFKPGDVAIGSATGNAGRLDLASGTLALNVIGTTGNWFFVGGALSNVVGGTGILNIADTSVTGQSNLTTFGQGSGGLTIGKLWVGGRDNNNGTGTANINTSGILSAQSTASGNAASVIVGSNTGSSGTLKLDNGTINTSGEFWVAHNGATGTVGMSGGAINATGTLAVGRISGSGSFTMSGGTVTTSSLQIAISTAATNTAIGTVTVNGGTLTSTGDMIVGVGGISTAAKGTLVIAGGTVNAGTTAEKWLKVGAFDTVTSQFDINSGTLNLNTNTDVRFSTNGGAGTNVINQNGGNVVSYSDNGITPGGSTVLDLQLASAAAANNTYNLNSGTLAISQVASTQTNGTRTFNFNGGTLKAASGASAATFFNLGTGNARANVRDGGAIIDTNGVNVTIAQVLAHSNIVANNPVTLAPDAAIDGGLKKQSSGMLTLTAVNGYTGPTLVTGGTLALSGSGDINTSPSITVNGSGAKLVHIGSTAISTPVSLAQGSVDGTSIINNLTVAGSAGNTVAAGNGAGGILTVGTLTFNGAAALNLRATGDYANQWVSVTSLIVAPSVDKIVVNVTNTSNAWTSNAEGYDYTLIDYDENLGGFTGNINRFIVGTVPNLNSSQTATVVDTGSAIVLRITGEPLIWTGGTGNWNTTENNWTFNFSPTLFGAGSPVLFDDSASTTNVNISQVVTPGAILFMNSGVDYTVSGSAIAGSTGLVMSGFGKVTLGNTNTYTGITTINSGILEISGTGSIASSSSITVNGSLILDLSGPSNVYANPITGTGSVTKLGAGPLTLSGTNTFSGAFTLDAGVLNFNSTSALGTGGGVITLNVGTLDNTSGSAVVSTSTKPQQWNTDITFTGSNSLAMGNGTVTLGGSGASRTVNVVANTFSVGALTGFGYDLVKTGTGTLQLNPTVASNITGTLNVTGPLNIGGQDFIATGLAGSGVIGNGSTIERWLRINNTTDQNFAGTLQDSGTGALGFLKQGAGSFTLAGPNTHTGAFTVDGGTLNLTGSLGANANNAAFRVGTVAGIPATLRIQPSATMGNRLNLHVGVAGAGTGGGAVYQSGSSLTLTGINADGFRLGSGAGGYGYYRLSTGDFTVGEAGIGAAANDTAGVMDISGGNFTTAGYITVGRGGLSSSGVLNVTGGTVNAGRVDLGWGGNDQSFSVLNVAAAVNISQTANGLNLANSNLAGVKGIANLLPGGTLTTTVVRANGADATALLNFNGGTLKAAATNSGVNFLTNVNIDAVTVYSGGGTIDNSGTPITIGAPLVAATGHGVSSITVSGGTGYIGAPLVKISGGTGTGATAHATIDASGNLTGIVIDNPGTGYSLADVLAVNLVGGAGSGALIGTVTLAPNTSGGLTITGAAITTLSGVNTYTGNTTVNSTSAVLLADNAGLKFVPTANGVSNKVTGAGSAYIYGDFTIDLTGVAVANGNSWTLVDTAAKTFDPLTFTVNGFTETTAGVHQLVDGAKTWTFKESDGTLSLSVGAVSGYALWAATNAPTGTANGDYDNDGVSNGVEYLVGGTASTNDLGKLPTVSSSGGNLVFTFVRVQSSETPDSAAVIQVGTTLTTWPLSYPVPNDPVVANPGVTVVDNGNGTDTITLRVPQLTDAKKFARLVVTVQ